MVDKSGASPADDTPLGAGGVPLVTDDVPLVTDDVPLVTEVGSTVTVPLAATYGDWPNEASFA